MEELRMIVVAFALGLCLEGASEFAHDELVKDKRSRLASAIDVLLWGAIPDREDWSSRAACYGSKGLSNIGSLLLDRMKDKDFEGMLTECESDNILVGLGDSTKNVPWGEGRDSLRPAYYMAKNWAFAGSQQGSDFAWMKRRVIFSRTAWMLLMALGGLGLACRGVLIARLLWKSGGVAWAPAIRRCVPPLGLVLAGVLMFRVWIIEDKEFHRTLIGTLVTQYERRGPDGFSLTIR